MMETVHGSRKLELGVKSELFLQYGIQLSVLHTLSSLLDLMLFFFRVYFVFIGKLDKKREETERKIQ